MLTRKNIMLAAGGLIFLLLLFPPKVIISTNPLAPDQEIVENAGYCFILSDPVKQETGGVMGSNELVHAHIKFIQYLLPIFIVGGIAGFLITKAPN